MLLQPWTTFVTALNSFSLSFMGLCDAPSHTINVEVNVLLYAVKCNKCSLSVSVASISKVVGRGGGRILRCVFLVAHIDTEERKG